MSQTAGPSNNDSILTEFTPTRYQEEFLRGDKRYLGFVSGVGAGKTYAGIIRTFLNMEKWNPGEMGAIVAPTRQMVINVIIPEMRDLGLLDKWEYNSSYSDEPGLRAPNGSRALILSADNKKTVERLRGLNLAWGYIDERTAVPDRAKEILTQRLRTGNYRNLFETTTPKGKDSTYEFYTQEQAPSQERFGEATVYESDNRLAIVGVPTGANPNTPEDYKEDMQNLPDDIRAQEVQGQFVEIGSGVFTRDMLTPIKPDRVSNLCSTVIGVDPAVTADAQAAESNDSDYWACAVIQVDRRNARIHVSDMAKRRGMSLQQGVEWISKVYQAAGEASVVCEANQSQRWLVQALNDAGVGTSPVQSTRNKENKLIDLSVPLESDTITFIDWTDEIADLTDPLDYYKDLISQLRAFPTGSHDDLIDALWLAVDNSNVSLGSIQSFDPFRNDD